MWECWAITDLQFEYININRCKWIQTSYDRKFSKFTDRSVVLRNWLWWIVTGSLFVVVLRATMLDDRSNVSNIQPTAAIIHPTQVMKAAGHITGKKIIGRQRSLTERKSFYLVTQCWVVIFAHFLSPTSVLRNGFESVWSLSVYYMVYVSKQNGWWSPCWILVKYGTSVWKWRPKISNSMDLFQRHGQGHDMGIDNKMYVNNKWNK